MSKSVPEYDNGSPFVAPSLIFPKQSLPLGSLWWLSQYSGYFSRYFRFRPTRCADSVTLVVRGWQRQPQRVVVTSTIVVVVICRRSREGRAWQSYEERGGVAAWGTWPVAQLMWTNPVVKKWIRKIFSQAFSENPTFYTQSRLLRPTPNFKMFLFLYELSLKTIICTLLWPPFKKSKLIHPTLLINRH